VNRSAFERWVADTGRDTAALTDAAYAALAQPTSNVPAQRYGTVAPMLYDHVLQLAAPLAGSGKEH
jgi:thymidine phosphorylase